MTLPVYEHGTPAAVWPVIHLAGRDLAFRNADLAAQFGATGVFVISMVGDDDAIDPVAVDIKLRHPQMKVGVNYLTLPAHVALARSLSLGMDATWTDRCGVRSDSVDERVPELSRMLSGNPTHDFFGSVAFKYQRPDADPPTAAKRAIEFGMIPTTSGEATGHAPPAEKLRRIREAIGNGPLALASGVAPENARELGAYLTHILVATGISRMTDTFDETLLRRLMKLVREPVSGA